MKAFIFSVGLCLVIILSFSCNQSPEPQKQKPNLEIQTFFGNIPTNVTIDGGIFTSSISKASIQQNSAIDNLGTSVDLFNYLNWPGVISITFNNILLTQNNKRLYTNPFVPHVWHVVRDSLRSIPEIDYTIEPAEANDILTPTMHSTVTRPFTLTWTTPTNPTGNDIVILISPEYLSDTSFTENIGKFVIHTSDDGSYTFTSDELSVVPANHFTDIYIIRFNYAVQTYDNKNYAFVSIFDVSVSVKIP